MLGCPQSNSCCDLSLTAAKWAWPDPRASAPSGEADVPVQHQPHQAASSSQRHCSAGWCTCHVQIPCRCLAWSFSPSTSKAPCWTRGPPVISGSSPVNLRPLWVSVSPACPQVCLGGPLTSWDSAFLEAGWETPCPGPGASVLPLSQPRRSGADPIPHGTRNVHRIIMAREARMCTCARVQAQVGLQGPDCRAHTLPAAVFPGSELGNCRTRA